MIKVFNFVYLQIIYKQMSCKYFTTEQKDNVKHNNKRIEKYFIWIIYNKEKSWCKYWTRWIFDINVYINVSIKHPTFSYATKTDCSTQIFLIYQSSTHLRLITLKFHFEISISSNLTTEKKNLHLAKKMKKKKWIKK